MRKRRWSPEWVAGDEVWEEWGEEAVEGKKAAEVQREEEEDSGAERVRIPQRVVKVEGGWEGEEGAVGWVWSGLEDAVLCGGVKEYGDNWGLVAEGGGGGVTPAECVDRLRVLLSSHCLRTKEQMRQRPVRVHADHVWRLMECCTRMPPGKQTTGGGTRLNAIITTARAPPTPNRKTASPLPPRGRNFMPTPSVSVGGWVGDPATTSVGYANYARLARWHGEGGGRFCAPLNAGADSPAATAVARQVEGELLTPPLAPLVVVKATDAGQEEGRLGTARVGRDHPMSVLTGWVDGEKGEEEVMGPFPWDTPSLTHPPPCNTPPMGGSVSCSACVGHPDMSPMGVIREGAGERAAKRLW